MSEPDWTAAAWRKSIMSDSGGCVEVARSGEHIGVRDTKDNGNAAAAAKARAPSGGPARPRPKVSMAHSLPLVRASAAGSRPTTPGMAACAGGSKNELPTPTRNTKSRVPLLGIASSAAG